jgi:hypothetical protein
MTTIDIAMSCFNSAPFLDRALAAILAQTGPTWRIIAFDDGSKDATSDVLSAWKGRLGDRLVIIDNPTNRNFGVSVAYSKVLAATTSPVVLLADADDVWLPGHLECVVGEMARREAHYGAATPLLVCTDATVVDEHEDLISPSFWRWDRSDPNRVSSAPAVAMESPVLGPTVALNRALIETALPIPQVAWSQDWWLAMVAAAFGKIHAVRSPTILYRRHGSNKSSTPIGSIGRALRAPAATRRRVRQLIDERAPQAAEFVQRYGARMSAADATAMAAIADLPNQGPFSRRASLLRHRLLFASPVKTWGMLLLC